MPDKEFRYLRTVIVTAAVYWDFDQDLAAHQLIFQHRAGITPYTSTFVFAECCVFSKHFDQDLAAHQLIFQHRAGITPYTSTFVFAECCVFSKQSQPPIL